MHAVILIAIFCPLKNRLKNIPQKGDSVEKNMSDVIDSFRPEKKMNPNRTWTITIVYPLARSGRIGDRPGFEMQSDIPHQVLLSMGNPTHVFHTCHPGGASFSSRLAPRTIFP